MKFLRVFLCIALCFALIFSACSCADGNKSDVRDPKPQSTLFFDYFDTVSTIYDYSGLSGAEFDKLAEYVKEGLKEYHELYDIYNEYEGKNNLALINRLAGQGAIKADPRIIDMLSFAKEMYTRTSGNVNVAMGAVLEIWHEYRAEGKEVPNREQLLSAAEHTDIEKLIINKENLTVELLDPEMSLDVGAVGKGYAVEMIAAELEALGYTSIVLDVGGNLRAIGEKPSGNGWATGVQNPDPADVKKPYVYTAELKNGAIVTSGSYQRFYTVEGVDYHHIINGKTLMPENYYTSVSVISDSSALSDALSTAIFNMRYEEASEFVNGFLGIKVVLVMPDGEVSVLPQTK